MARRRRTARRIARTGDFLLTSAINGVIGAILLTALLALIAQFESFGTIISGIVVLTIAGFVIPQILRMRRGQETFLTFVFGTAIGGIVISLISTFINIDIPTLSDGLVIGSVTLVLAVGSYFTADWLQMMVRRR